MKLHIFKHLHKAESSGGEAEETDFGPVLQAVEESRLALEEAQSHRRRAEAVGARARRIDQRNGFGQLLEKLSEARPKET